MSRTGRFLPFIYIGSIIATIGAGLMSSLDENSNQGMTIGYLFVAGVGIGCMIQTRVIGAQAMVTQEWIAIITATSGFAQTMGGVVGIAVTGAIITNTLSSTLEMTAPNVPASLVVNNPDGFRHLPIFENNPGLLDSVIRAFVQAIDDGFKAPIVFCGCILICAFFIDNITIRKPGR